MDDQFIEDPLIVRADARKEDTPGSRGAGPDHAHYYALGKGKTDRHMDPFYIEFDGDGEKQLSSHEGEEFIIVVSGKVELIYGKAMFVLGPGDSMYYNSVVPHHVGSANDEPASITPRFTLRSKVVEMVRHEITREATLGQLLDETVVKYPDNEAIVYADRDYRETWSEFSNGRSYCERIDGPGRPEGR